MAASHTPDRGLFSGRSSPTLPTAADAFVPARWVIGTSYRPRASAPLTSLGLDVSQRLPQQPLVHGLAEKHTAGRKVVIVRSALARHHDDFDGRPANPYRMSQLETVHGTRHVNVSDHDADVGSGHQQLDRLVRVECL